MLRALLALLLAFAAAPAIAQGEIVTFPSADGTPVRGVLYQPQGRGPFPAVVALHGCGGLVNNRGALTARHADWADRWVGQGFVVLFPDSFGSRGLRSICSESARGVTPRRERTADALGALAYLQERPDVRRDRVNLVGWSNGGSTVLYATRTGVGPRGGPDFARAIAFYPGCSVPLRTNVQPRLPLLVLIGEDDNWTPAAPCRDLADRSRGTEIVLYPGAVHDFDNPVGRIRERTGLAFTADGTGRALVGPDPAARADAIRRVTAYLAR